MINKAVDGAISQHQQELQSLAKDIAMMTIELDKKKERFVVVNNILSTFEFVQEQTNIQEAGKNKD